MHRNDSREFAIKKFKPDREGDTHHYVGISQSACREIAVILVLYYSIAFYSTCYSCVENFDMKTL